MATQEIYIRNAADTEARGPFNLQQLHDLVEAGQVTKDTLFYDTATEQWTAISASEEMTAVVFPEKKKISLKAKEVRTLNTADSENSAISVNDMLDAAEGRTPDTKGRGDPRIAMMRAAKVGSIGAIASLLLAAVGEALPGAEALLSMSGAKLLAQPLALLGVLDLGLAVLLGLGMFSIYPFIRFRAALGLGLMGFMFYAQGLSSAMGALVLGSTGLYLCTVFVSMPSVLLATAAGTGGMGLLAWQLLHT